MSTANKLTYLNTTKSLIKDNLNLGGANISNEPFRVYSSKLIDIYKDFLANGTDTLWNNWNKVSESGTNITLNNTIKAPMRIDLNGNTQQNGTPTPDSPVDIHVVSGDNTIKVENAKDIFNMKEYASENSGYFTYSSDTGLTAIAKDNRATANVGYPIELTPNTTYYVKTDTDKRLLISQYNSNNGWLVNNEVFDGGSFTTNTNASYIRVKVADTLTTFPAVVGNVYISTSNDYQKESYPINLGTLELCWIPNTTYRDRIFKAVNGDEYYDSLTQAQKDELTYGAWYLHKEIGKVVLDGSENWTYDTAGGFNKFSTLISNSYVGTGRQACLSNYFKNNLTSNADGICFIVNGNVYLYKNDITTANDFKTWLNTHNTEVYYQLATPTYTKITDTNLISDLNNIYNLKSYNDTTNISVDGDLPMILDVSALINY